MMGSPPPPPPPPSSAPKVASTRVPPLVGISAAIRPGRVASRSSVNRMLVSVSVALLLVMENSRVPVPPGATGLSMNSLEKDTSRIEEGSITSSRATARPAETGCPPITPTAVRLLEMLLWTPGKIPTTSRVRVQVSPAGRGSGSSGFTSMAWVPLMAVMLIPSQVVEIEGGVAMAIPSGNKSLNDKWKASSSPWFSMV